MFPLRYFVLCFAILAVSLNVNGLSDSEKELIKSALIPLMSVCGKEFGVTEDEIKAAMEAGTVKDMDPCFIACFLKKTGILNDNGMFDVEKATELTKKFVPNDDEQKKALGIIESCARVNDEPVTDDKGCQRSKFLYDCYLPFKGQIPDSPLL